MTHLTRRSLILIAALAGIAESAYGQICVNSDSAGDTACGSYALEFGKSDGGGGNSAFGSNALELNTTGSENTASGLAALELNTTGSDNTASGSRALELNTTGSANTASGYQALQSNTTGDTNTASGWLALTSNQTGSNNTATGVLALAAATGSNNIAAGASAGRNVTTGSDNIEIGNDGAAGDNKVIKIGTEGTQKKAFIAGVYSNTAVSGLAVVIGSNGELGAVSSSRRFKTAIAPMGANTEKLQQLRPVTFHYKADPQGTVRYGLIAEEVAKVYPELVVRDDQGRIDGVRYDELAPMLLNEVQKQQQINAAQTAKIASLERKVAEVDDLKQQLSAVLQELKARDKLVAQR
ncbi:MAG: tail fiber domain-containing protein [Steroidobacteraceae bacterium]|jgi:hypothetical protein